VERFHAAILIIALARSTVEASVIHQVRDYGNLHLVVLVVKMVRSVWSLDKF
jgi:hypothetical protein